MQLFKKAEEESESVHRIRGRRTAPSDVPSHMHTWPYSAKTCTEVERVVSILPTPRSVGYPTDGLEQAPSPAINRRHATQPQCTVQLKMPSTKRQCLENSFVHNYELCVIAQTWPFSHRGNGICTLKIPELV